MTMATPAAMVRFSWTIVAFCTVGLASGAQKRGRYVGGAWLNLKRRTDRFIRFAAIQEQDYASCWTVRGGHLGASYFFL
jgi:hypothetical protein